MNAVIVRADIDSQLSEIESVLPKSVSLDVFCRAAKIAISDNDDLFNADATSVIKSLSKCATDGLVPDGKEAALVVFNKKVKNNGQESWEKHAQYMPMVDGVLKRARLSGEVLNISAKVVYENDQFDYWVDESGEHFNHRPEFVTRGEIKLVYAFARLKSGELVFEAMIKDEIDKVRASSKSGTYGAWKDWYDRMALKSALHRLTRRLPNASEMIEMLELGNQMNFNDQQSEKTITKKELPPYPQKKLDANFDAWKNLIQGGDKKADEVINTIKSAYTLSDSQIETIKNMEAIEHENA